ncbi:MAG: hypothetical protein ACFHVJ_13735 [Aestuariibacter sp.]
MRTTLAKFSIVVTMCLLANTSGFSSEQSDNAKACPLEHQDHAVLHTHELTKNEQQVVNEQLQALLQTNDPELILAAQILLNHDKGQDL